MTEKNNTLTLTRADLTRPLSELFKQVMENPDRIGLPRLTYSDRVDHFSLRLEKTNLGFSVSCALNNQTAYALNDRRFAGSACIGCVMLVAAGSDQTVEEFFR